MIKELEEAKKVFVEGVDDEDRAENLRVLTEWEQGLEKNRLYADWKKNDVTQQINEQVKKSYVDFAITLAENRSLTPAQRESLWAKQDACLFLLGLTDLDVQSALQGIQMEIKRALAVTRG